MTLEINWKEEIDSWAALNCRNTEYHMSRTSLHPVKPKVCPRKIDWAWLKWQRHWYDLDANLLKSLVWERIFLFMSRFCHGREFDRERKFEITVYLKWSFWSTYRLYYALRTYSCNTQCIQVQTRHLQHTKLFWRPLQDLTPKLQRSPRYIGLGSTPQLFCKSFTISPN